MEIRSPRFALALALSATLHAALLALVLFVPRSAPPEIPPQPSIVVLELAALGTPEAPEEKPPPPAEKPAPSEKPAPPPEPLKLPEIEAPPVPPPPPEVIKKAVPLPPTVAVRPEPKPEPQPPEPPPEAPAATAPNPPAARERPVPPASAPSPPEDKPRKGIETGVAGGTSQEEMSRYITTLFTMIDAKKAYPPQSLQRHEQGTVTVTIKIAADGKLIDVTSPAEEPNRLVSASLEAVRRAAPFPPLPSSLKKDEADFQVPVVYKLQ
jgi:protein TonB